ncbi:MAG: DUF1800 domain-containing protein [Pseudomonadota bacterium]
MRTLLWLVVCFPVLAFAGMGEDEARHLLLRTGWAATPQQVAVYAQLSRAQAVDRVLDGTHGEAATPLPADLQVFTPPPRRRGELSEAERKAFQREQIQLGLEMRSWWFAEMLATDSPLTEKMTLFWHNHFVSSQQKVRFPKLLVDQNRLLRQQALGNFGTLLHAIARDPAMVLYLDSAQNRRAAPNENFARELMELFTLGEGQYGERDVKEAARAFTGWSIDRQTGAFRFYRFLHDGGDKTVLGRTGAFDGDDVLGILLAQPATAEFLTRKLWREFVSPDPDPAEVARIAAVLRQSHYAIRPWLRALLLSPAFWTPAHRGVLVKSPVEFLLGLIETLDVAGVDPRVLALASRQLGQDLFAPPNVKGWPGGDAWISSTTLLARRQMVERLFRANEAGSYAAMQPPTGAAGRDARLAQRLARGMDGFSVDAGVLDGLGRDEASARTRFASLTLAVPPAGDLAARDRRGFLQALAQDAAFQLK